MTAPFDVRRTVQPNLPVPQAPGAVALSALLQTTLDLAQQIELLAGTVTDALAVGGVCFKQAPEALEIVHGDPQGHKVDYDLAVENEHLGNVCFYRSRPFRETELNELEGLLCALVYPLRNALAYRQAVERALRDPLTGVQNRMALNNALDREIETSRRHGTPLSMLVLDIDHFKGINDTHGHSFGDDVLKAVAQTAGTTIRRCDEIFRFGGEEFVILARHTDEDGARQLAERIRKDIESIGTVNGADARVTVSIGVAIMPPASDADDLFERADQALYQAKKQGRNRWVVAS